MKAKKLIFMISMLLVVNAAIAQDHNKQKFKKLEWLTGKWARTNAKAGQSGYETWERVSDLKLSGKGVTLKGKEVIFIENLEFMVIDSDIFYKVTLAEDEKPVYFKLTALSKNGFTCENPEHDFPKKITYIRNGNHIKAVISGNGKSVDYIFIREKAK